MSAGLVDAAAMTAAESAALLARLEQPDFLGFGFVHVGAWGRRPG